MFPEKNGNEWGERSWLKISDFFESMMSLAEPEWRKLGGRRRESRLTKVRMVPLQKKERWCPQRWHPVVWGWEDSGSVVSGAGGGTGDTARAMCDHPGVYLALFLLFKLYAKSMDFRMGSKKRM